MARSQSTALRWDFSSIPKSISPDAIVVGHDSDGDIVFAGCAEHDGDLLPAKIVPYKRAAYVSHGGRNHKKYHYHILCGNFYEWISVSSDSVVPSNVVASDRKKKQTYIGRGLWKGSMILGQINPTNCRLYILCDDDHHEIQLERYEVLVPSRQPSQDYKLDFERRLQFEMMRFKETQMNNMKEYGNNLFVHGQYSKARRQYTEALRMDSHNKNMNYKLYYNRAVANSKMGHLGDSIADMTKALKFYITGKLSENVK